MTKHKIRFGIGDREVILILEASATELPSVYFYHHDSVGSLLSGVWWLLFEALTERKLFEGKNGCSQSRLLQQPFKPKAASYKGDSPLTREWSSG
ncbi:Uncharacterized protein HZ326_1550 [Fusarium oxysporum f. sp. albedinis]|nr:Uncharacterized protein HZ326_1550 [Fusarium oxysporum f. sp. albedinis]